MSDVEDRLAKVEKEIKAVQTEDGMTELLQTFLGIQKQQREDMVVTTKELQVAILEIRDAMKMQAGSRAACRRTTRGIAGADSHGPLRPGLRRLRFEALEDRRLLSLSSLLPGMSLSEKVDELCGNGVHGSTFEGRPLAVFVPGAGGYGANPTDMPRLHDYLDRMDAQMPTPNPKYEATRSTPD